MADQNTEAPVAEEKPVSSGRGMIEGASSLRDVEGIDDLIPPELRALAAEDEVDEEEQDSEKPAEEPEQPVTEEEDDEDGDITPDDIDKLLSGKEDDAETEEEEQHFWAESDDYKALKTTLENIGADTSNLDKVLQHVADKTKVDQGIVVQGLREEAENSKKSVEQVQGELDRLRQIERAVRFDNADTTKEKYIAPMQSAAQKISQIIEREGSPVSVQKILGAKNRAEMTALFDDAKIPDEDMNTIANQWREYKELLTEYTTEREAAQKDLTKALGTAIAPETVDKIMKNALSDMLQQDERFAYVRDAIEEGLDGHDDVAQMITQAQANYRAFVGALSNPSAKIHSSKYLDQLAKYAMGAAHGQLMEDRYYTLSDEYKNLKTAAAKLSRKYKELVESARGITNERGIARAPANGNKDMSEDDKEEAAAAYKKLLTDDRAIDDILGL